MRDWEEFKKALLVCLQLTAGALSLLIIINILVETANNIPPDVCIDGRKGQQVPDEQ